MDHLHEIVKVNAIFDPELRGKIDVLLPLDFTWRNREYKISEISLHYTRMIDGVLNHIYCGIAGGSYVELNFNTKTLLWSIERAVDSEMSA